MCKRPGRYCKSHIRDVKDWCSECQAESGYLMTDHNWQAMYYQQKKYTEAAKGTG